jgi:hypothetical protein
MPDAATHDPLAEVRALAAALTHTIGVVRALAESGRAIDLIGLDREVGLLCAQSLDLPPDAGRCVRPQLIALSGAVEALSRVLAARAAPSG